MQSPPQAAPRASAAPNKSLRTPTLFKGRPRRAATPQTNTKQQLSYEQPAVATFRPFSFCPGTTPIYLPRQVFRERNKSWRRSSDELCGLVSRILVRRPPQARPARARGRTKPVRIRRASRLVRSRVVITKHCGLPKGIFGSTLIRPIFSFLCRAPLTLPVRMLRCRRQTHTALVRHHTIANTSLAVPVSDFLLLLLLPCPAAAVCRARVRRFGPREPHPSPARRLTLALAWQQLRVALAGGRCAQSATWQH